jgi:hypothetical protein
VYGGGTTGNEAAGRERLEADVARGIDRAAGWTLFVASDRISGSNVVGQCLECPGSWR